MEKQIEIRELAKLTNELTILYVEDEAAVRESMSNGVFPKLFREFYIAEDGQEGLELYKKHDPDIVITDIRMPNMDGLEMTKHIRDISEDVHIIITTAHNDQDYFLDSIKMGVDEYIVKPFDTKNILTALMKTAQNVRNRKLAEKMRKIELQQAIQAKTDQAIYKMANIMLDPVAIMREDKLLFLNNAFMALLPDETAEAVLRGYKSLDELLLIREGYVRTLEEISEKEQIPKKVILQCQKGNRVFLARSRELDEQNALPSEIDRLLIFTDITEVEKQKLLMEYQKNKIANYNEILEEILITKYFRKPKKEEPQVAEESGEKTLQTPVSHVDALLSEEEKELLRRRRERQISAETYYAEMGEELNQEIAVLGEIERELSEMLEAFIGAPGEQNLLNISKALDEYASSVNMMVEFMELGNALFSLAAFLRELSEDKIHRSEAKIRIYMENILTDLIEWRSKIFIAQDTQDIHYLDASLFSSCLQMQLELGAQQGQDAKPDDDDLGMELF